MMAIGIIMEELHKEWFNSLYEGGKKPLQGVYIDKQADYDLRTDIVWCWKDWTKKEIAMTKEMKKSPFKTGRRSAVKREGGLFLSVKEDDTHVFVPLQGLDGMVSGDMHEYWDVRPAVFHPCIGTDCPGCQNGNDSRFKGYLPIMMKDGSTKVYAFTTTVYNQLEELEDMMDDNSLKGKAIKVRRTGTGFKTRYSLVATGKQVDVDEVEAPNFIHLLGPDEADSINEMLVEGGVIESYEPVAPKVRAKRTTKAAEETADDEDDKWDF